MIASIAFSTFSYNSALPISLHTFLTFPNSIFSLITTLTTVPYGAPLSCLASAKSNPHAHL